MGYSACVIADVLDFQDRDKSFYLYTLLGIGARLRPADYRDISWQAGRQPPPALRSFEGLSEKYSTDQERAFAPNEMFSLPNLHKAVVARFRRYDNIHVIRGVVPDVLAQTCPEKIAFLHLDMNAAQAEIGALDALFDKVVRGGYIVLDDFGRSRLASLCVEETAWMKTRGYEVLELPTGQGLVIKR